MIVNIQKEVLKHNSFLLLQGPKGIFFYKLACFLKSIGKRVYKINFNGGDLITYPSFKNTYNYRGKIENFESYLKDLINSRNIEAIILYGDYKPYHKIAIEFSKKINLPVYVFEEGYIRPYYITLERGGINGWSNLPRNPDFYKKLPDIKVSEPLPTHPSYLKKTISRFVHYFFLELFRWYFPHYVPAKKYFPYIPTIYCWLRGLVKKPIYILTEKKTMKLIIKLKGKYFFVPLQVHNDTQITIHSNYTSIEEFISEVIESFAKYAKKEDFLVFKHHPEDRGFKNYKKIIKNCAMRWKILDRVFYIHDGHLPTLIKGCKGVIVINSTVGLQALYHNRPVKVMGRAIYDIPGLTFQGSLDDFWKNPGEVDIYLMKKFRNFVILTTQLNGSFYGRFPFDKNILSSISFTTASTASSTDKRCVSSIKSGFSGSS